MTNHPYQIGKTYLIRTVTFAYTGRLVQVYDGELVLDGAAWIADTGRFHNALKDASVFNEIEPYPNDVIVSRGSIVDATVIPDFIAVQK